MKRIIYIIAIYAFLPLCASGQLVSAWNIGIGGTPSFVPTTDKTLKPVSFTMESGVEIKNHHQLTFDGGFDYENEKTGEAKWKTYTYGSVIYVDPIAGVIPQGYKEHTEDIYRTYSHSFFVFSYHYVINMGNAFRMHLGPTLGGYYTKADTDYESSGEKEGRPKIDNNEKKSNSFVYGIGVGFSAGRRGYIDLRYRYLTGKALEIEDMATKEYLTTKGQIHQINIIIGFRWKIKRGQKVADQKI